MTSSPPEAREGSASIRVHSKVWVERDGVVLMSDYRVRLLEAVAARGSVAGAAAAMRLPTRTAWKKLREMERSSGARLLESGSGGVGGGGSRLTPEATEMLAAFRRVRGLVRTEVRQRFSVERRHFQG